MEQTDEQLVAAYIDGDERALEILIKRYAAQVYHLIFRLVGNARDAEDLTQEAFVKLWRYIGSYRPGGNFRAWLYKIARRTAIDWLRKKRPTTFTDFTNEAGENPLIETLRDPEPLPDEIVARIEDNRLLNTLLADLSPAHREALIMHYHDHLTFEEIAILLGIPLDTVKSRHRRAILALRNHIHQTGTVKF